MYSRGGNSVSKYKVIKSHKVSSLLKSRDHSVSTSRTKSRIVKVVCFN